MSFLFLNFEGKYLNSTVPVCRGGGRGGERGLWLPIKLAVGDLGPLSSKVRGPPSCQRCVLNSFPGGEQSLMLKVYDSGASSKTGGFCLCPCLLPAERLSRDAPVRAGSIGLRLLCAGQDPAPSADSWLPPCGSLACEKQMCVFLDTRHSCGRWEQATCQRGGSLRWPRSRLH